MGLFDKKYCDVCGEKIRLLGNRKLEDGNLCKNCAEKLSPWFSERRHSTLQEIKEQLAYREDNKEAVRNFHTTRSFGKYMKLLIDEDNRKFMVTSARDLEEANPDVLDYSQVTGVDLDIDENRSELYREDKEGNKVSYSPPKYEYYYYFDVIIRVNHPYFDDMRFRLNSESVKTGTHRAGEPAVQRPVQINTGGGIAGVLGSALTAAMNNVHNETWNAEYNQYVRMGEEIKECLMSARQQVRDQAEKTAVICPFCGAKTVPDMNNCCEYCGGRLAD